MLYIIKKNHKSHFVSAMHLGFHEHNSFLTRQTISAISAPIHCLWVAYGVTYLGHHEFMFTAFGQVCTKPLPKQILTDEIETLWYRQISNISCTFEGDQTVDHSDAVGASPVRAAPTTSSFST